MNLDFTTSSLADYLTIIKVEVLPNDEYPSTLYLNEYLWSETFRIVVKRFPFAFKMVVLKDGVGFFAHYTMLLVNIFGFSGLRVFVLTKNFLWGVKFPTTFSFNLSITNLRNGRQLARLYFSAVVLLFVLLQRLKVLSSLKLDQKLKI